MKGKAGNKVLQLTDHNDPKKPPQREQGRELEVQRKSPEQQASPTLAGTPPRYLSTPKSGQEGGPTIIYRFITGVGASPNKQLIVEGE